MKLIVVFTILLVAGITYFSFNKKFKSFRKKFSNGIDFYFTLIATIIGVLLAFYFSDLAEKKKEKQYVVDILEIVSSNLEQNVQNNVGTLELYKQIKLDSFNVSINPLNYPNYVESIVLSDPILNQHISHEVYKLLLSNFETSKKMRNLFHSFSFKQSSTVAEQYNQTLAFISELIDMEIDRQNRTISDEEMTNQLKILSENLKKSYHEVEEKPMIKK